MHQPMAVLSAVIVDSVRIIFCTEKVIMIFYGMVEGV